MALADLLEQMSNQRQQNMPTLRGLDPTPGPVPAPAMEGDNASLQSLLPLLLQGNSGGGGGMPQGGGSRWENVAERMAMNKYGYSPADWQKLDWIIDEAPNAESHWNPSAQNPNSPAAGIAQNIRGFGPGYQENRPKQQIRWLLNYIQNHNYPGYGTGIDAAYAHKQATGWY